MSEEVKIIKRGGARVGAGRKRKNAEIDANKLFSTALGRIYNTEEEEEAKIKFIQELSKTQRGMIFIAEHVFGKAPQVLESDAPFLQMPIISFGNKS